MKKIKIKRIYPESAFKVESMQGFVQDIFELNRCLMRGENNRWLAKVSSS